jgi:hypothetical protein
MTRLSTDDRDELTGESFAFPHQRKEPLDNARHVRDAIARFDRVEGVSDADRDAAWTRILSAARKFGVEVHEKSWRELPKRSKSRSRDGPGASGSPAQRRGPARREAATGAHRPMVRSPS